MKIRILIIALLIGLVSNFCRAQDGPSGEAFKAVTQELDADGDLYLYLSSAAFLRRLDQKYRDTSTYLLKKIEGGGQRRIENMRAVLDLGADLMEGSGIRDLHAFGLSSKAMDGGMYRSKLVLYHPPSRKRGKLWEILSPTPHKLKGIDFLPATTMAAVCGDLHAGKLWKWAVEILKKRKEVEVIDQLLSLIGIMKMQGLDIGAICSAIDGQMGGAFTLDEKQTITIPRGRTMLRIPKPGYFFFARSKTDAPLKTILSQLRSRRMPLQESRLPEGTTIYNFASFGQIALGMGFAFCHHNQWLMIASDAEMLRQAISCLNGKANGLAATQEYRDVTKGLPEKANAMIFVHPKLIPTAIEVISSQSRSKQQEADAHFMLELMGLKPGSIHGCAIGARTANGFVVTGRASVPLGDVLLTTGVAAPIAAAIIETSNPRRTINTTFTRNINNLKMTNIALMLYTIDHKGAFPAKDGAAGFTALVKQQKAFSTSILVSPFDRTRLPAREGGTIAEENTSYVYLGAGLKSSDPLAAKLPLCFDKPNLSEDGISVLFGDGHVEFIEGAFPTSEQFMKHLIKTHRLPKDRADTFLAKLKALTAK